MTELFVTADDRTGALEVGGIVASGEFSVPVGPFAADERCCVVDVATRHLSPEEAARRTGLAHSTPARFRCHKMDSGLRGNWPHEIRALTELGYRVAVVASFPDAGRRCRDGVVYVDDVPVLDSPFGQDPLTAPVSSKPIEVLEQAGINTGAVAVWDANDNAELHAAVLRCRNEGRVLVGPTGALGVFADTVFPESVPRPIRLPAPVLLVCGSLNATSREQIRGLKGPAIDPDHCPDSPLVLEAALTRLITATPERPVSTRTAEATARRVADIVSNLAEPPGTLFVIGGDTAAAIIGDETLEVLGTVDAAIPVSRFKGSLLVTKGGGIGTRETVTKLLDELI